MAKFKDAEAWIKDLKAILHPALYSCEWNSFENDVINLWKGRPNPDPAGKDRPDLASGVLLVVLRCLCDSKKLQTLLEGANKRHHIDRTFSVVLNQIISSKVFTVENFLVAINCYVETEMLSLQNYETDSKKNDLSEKVTATLESNVAFTAKLVLMIQSTVSSQSLLQCLETHQHKSIQKCIEKLIRGVCETAIFPKHPDFKDLCLLDNNQMEIYSSIACNCLKAVNVLMVWVNHYVDGEMPLKGFVKHIVKICVADVACLLMGHIGKHKWSSIDSRKGANILLERLFRTANAKNIEQMLIGEGDTAKLDGSTSDLLLREGIFELILRALHEKFINNGWKKDPTVKHVLLHTTMNVKYPNLKPYVRIIIPLLLEMSEDHQPENQVLAIGCLKYVIENVNPSDLNLYNHGEMIYQVFVKMLYGTNFVTMQILLPCLQRILFVIEPFPARVNVEKYSKWEKTIQKLLFNLEYENSTDMKKILLENLPDFINAIGVNCTKFLTTFLRVVSSCLELYDNKDCEMRKQALGILAAVVQSCWPVMDHHVGSVLKMLLRLIVDISMDELPISEEGKKSVRSKSLKIILILNCCCSSKIVIEYLNTAQDTEIDRDFDEVKSFLREAKRQIKDDFSLCNGTEACQADLD